MLKDTEPYYQSFIYVGHLQREETNNIQSLTLWVHFSFRLYFTASLQSRADVRRHLANRQFSRKRSKGSNPLPWLHVLYDIHNTSCPVGGGELDSFLVPALSTPSRCCLEAERLSGTTTRQQELRPSPTDV